MKNAYYNGLYSSIEEVMIPLSDRSVYFGDGVYDAMIGKNQKIYLLDAHLDRLLTNAKAVGLKVSEDKTDLERIINDVTRGFDENYFVYVQLSRKATGRKHACLNSENANLLITATPYPMPSPTKTLSLTLVEDVRYRMCNVKTLNLLPNVLASCRAEASGYDEAVFVRNGYVTECAHSNIFIVKNDELITHPDCELILPGIMKKQLLKAAGTLGVNITERPFTPAELYSADSVLISSTSKLVLSAESVDGKRLKTGKNSTAKMLVDAAFSDYWKVMENR